MKPLSTYLFCLIVLTVTIQSAAFAQLSQKTVKYKVTYDYAGAMYTVWVHPDYATPNANNPLSNEYTATAQVSLKVPSAFFITEITDINGTWVKNARRLGDVAVEPYLANFAHLIDTTARYYCIGKVPTETKLPAFGVGDSIALFSFRGNGVHGPVGILGAKDPFISFASQELSLNVGNSFYSRSGQARDVNAIPLEQFLDKLLPDADPTAFPPVAIYDINNTFMNTSVVGHVGTNDFDPKNLPLRYSVQTYPLQGRLTFEETGRYLYIPNQYFIGNETFTYKVCNLVGACDTAQVTIKVFQPAQVNTVIANNDAVRTTENAKVRVAVLANDLDLEGDPFGSLDIWQMPLLGKVEFKKNDSTFVYTPPKGLTGKVTFGYRLFDKRGAVDSALVVVEILPRQLAKNRPLASDDALTTRKNKTQKGKVWTNDFRPVNDSLQAASADFNGALAMNADPTDGTYIYSLLTKPTHGNLLFSPSGDFAYSPNRDFVGNDAYTYKVCLASDAKRCDSATVYLTISESGLYLRPKVYLQGALFGVTYKQANGEVDSLMRDDLRALGLLPRVAPSSLVPESWKAPQDSVTDQSIFAVTGRDAIIDWIFVELRSNLDTSVVARRWALLQRDGDIVGNDGVSPLRFDGLNPDYFFVTVRHRNHLSVMTQKANLLGLGENRLDFTNNSQEFVLGYQPFHIPQVKVLQGRALWAGNALQNQAVIFQGSGNDVSKISQEVLGNKNNKYQDENFTIKGYNIADVNMDGRVNFKGTGADSNFIYQNVLMNNLGNQHKDSFFVIREQLPK